MIKAGRTLYDSYGNKITVTSTNGDDIYGEVTRHTKVSYNGGANVREEVHRESIIFSNNDIGVYYFFSPKDIRNKKSVLSSNAYKSNKDNIEKHIAKEESLREQYFPYGPRLTPNSKAQIIKYYESDEKEEEAFHKRYPYCFGRMDLDTELTIGQTSKKSFDDHFYDQVYISKSAYLQVGEKQIVNWRSDIASMYYDQFSTTKKSLLYIDAFSEKTAIGVPGIEYTYSLMLKRAYSDNPFRYKNLYIVNSESSKENGDIIPSPSAPPKESIYEQGSIDPFLLQVIEEKRLENKLTDIIATIQSNQNAMIRHTEKKGMVVQGCAGSGKTMILLHRISYLLYNHKLNHYSRALIIVPNKRFRLFIDELATNLEIEKIERVTIWEYYLRSVCNVQKKIDLNSGLKDDSIINWINRQQTKLFLSENVIPPQESIDKRFMDSIESFWNNFETSLFAKCHKAEIIRIARRVGLDEDLVGSTENQITKLYALASHDIDFASEEIISKAQKAVRDAWLKKDYVDKYLICVKTRINQVERLFSNSAITATLSFSDIVSFKYGSIDSNMAKVDLLKKKLLALTSQIEKMKSKLSGFNLWQQITMRNELKSLREKITNTKDQLKETKSDLEKMQFFLDNQELIEAIQKTSDEYFNLAEKIQQYNYLFKKSIDSLDSYLLNDWLEEISVLVESIATSKEVAAVDKAFSDSELELKSAKQRIPSTSERDLLANAESFLKTRNKIVFKAYKEWNGNEDVTSGPRLFALYKMYQLYTSRIIDDYDFIFIDEGQDYSPEELSSIHTMHGNNCIIEVYGDLLQRIFSNRGMSNWNDLCTSLGSDYYELKENYRNTVEIAEYVNSKVTTVFRPIGIHGENVSEQKATSQWFSIYSQKKIQYPEKRFAVIVHDKNKIGCNEMFGNDLLSVAEAKGLEFDYVYVINNEMTQNERYIAYSRALTELTVIS